MVTKTTGQRMNNYIKNFVPCPQCGEHWYILSAAKRPTYSVYKRQCRACGHTANTDREGQLHLPRRKPSIPCPDCGKPWRVSGQSGRHRQSHHCHHCGRKGVVTSDGVEVPARDYSYPCPDCGDKLKLMRRSSYWGYYTCTSSACQHEFVRRYGSKGVFITAAEHAARPKNYRSPAQYTPETLARRAAAKVQRETERRAQQAERAAAKRAAPPPPRVTIDTLPQLPVMVKARVARRSVEDLRMERELAGHDPLFT